jgi:hypothetical protein
VRIEIYRREYSGPYEFFYGFILGYYKQKLEGDSDEKSCSISG